MSKPRALDSYECDNCGEWSHHVQDIPTAPHGRPQFCPYCGYRALTWRTDNNWKLVGTEYEVIKTFAPAPK